MIRRNSRGEIIESRRTVDTRVSGELLVGAGWEAIAHTELRRLTLSIGIYQKQLEDCSGYLELGRAIEALDSACKAIADSAEYDDEKP